MFFLDVIRPVWPRLHQAMFVRLNRHLMQRGYFAEVPLDLAALPVCRREQFPEVGPAPWLDGEYAQHIAAKVGSGQLTEADAETCRTFAREGYVVLRGFFDGDYLDEVWAAYEAAIRGGVVRLQPERAGPDDSLPGRFLNPHRWVPAIAGLLRDARLKRVLDMLIGRETIPFQSIAAHKGSQQPAHSDAIHMTTFPLGYLIAAWTAFENVHPDSGPLLYCPASHRLSYALSREVGIGPDDFARGGYETYRQCYEPFIERRIRDEHLEVKHFLARKGDVFVWHHNLIHGGSPRRDLRLSRKSIVTHHFTRGAICYHDLSGQLADAYGLLPASAGDEPKVIATAEHGAE